MLDACGGTTAPFSVAKLVTDVCRVCRRCPATLPPARGRESLLRPRACPIASDRPRIQPPTFPRFPPLPPSQPPPTFSHLPATPSPPTPPYTKPTLTSHHQPQNRLRVCGPAFPSHPSEPLVRAHVVRLGGAKEASRAAHALRRDATWSAAPRERERHTLGAIRGLNRREAVVARGGGDGQGGGGGGGGGDATIGALHKRC